MPKEYGPAMSFAFGGLAGSCACVLSNPFEVVKTRFQLQGELAGGEQRYRSLRHAFRTIWKEEGVRGIQRGLGASVGFQVVFNGVRIGLFDHVKAFMYTDAAPAVSTLASGATTGCMSAAVASPLFMVKCRLQAQVSGGGVAVGTQHGYRNLLHGVTCVYRDSGVRGLYRGLDGFLGRTAVGSAFQLSVFDATKGTLQQACGPWVGTLSAAALAGLAATAAMNPLDVVTTRLYNQPRLPSGAGALYSGPLDCLLKSLRKEGPPVLAKGLLTHVWRLVPHTVYSLVFFEQFKLLAQRAGL